MRIFDIIMPQKGEIMVHVTTAEELEELMSECKACNSMAKWDALPHEDAIDEESFEEVLGKIKPEIEKVDKSNLSTSYKTVNIKTKFKINDLDTDTKDDITRALCYYEKVDEYVIGEDRLRPRFHRRLANLFIILYNECLEKGYDGSQTYRIMQQWFKKRLGKPALDLVVSALVAYLFAKCDIFQKTEAEKRQVG